MTIFCSDAGATVIRQLEMAASCMLDYISLLEEFCFKAHINFIELRLALLKEFYVHMFYA